MKKILYFLIALVFIISLYSAERAHIQIISEPGVTIFLDDIYQGRTSEEMGGLIVENVLPGSRLIKSVKHGFTPQISNVILNPGEVYILRLVNFIPKIDILQSGKYDTEKIALQVGSITIQSLPVAIDIEIPSLDIFDKKIKDEWKASNVPVGKYEATYKWENKILRDSIIIRSDLNFKTFVNFIKGETTNNNAINKIATTSEINKVNKTIEKEIYISPELQEKLDLYGLIQVKGGIYQIGSETGESDESPIHSVKVNSFYIAKNEVTVRDYIKFLNANDVTSYGSLNGKDLIDIEDYDCPIEYTDNNFVFKASKYAKKDLCPITEVSWHGAIAYCDWLSNIVGEKFRLPSEAEWQYAARGGNKTENFLYSGSNDIAEVAWYATNSENKLHEVGKKKPNELGLYDMSGNATEWCLDWYNKDYYKHMPFDNPKGPKKGRWKLIQGGSVSTPAEQCRVAARDRYSHVNSVWTNGFRVLMELPEEK